MPRFSKSEKNAYAEIKKKEALRKLREIAKEIGFNLTPMRKKNEFDTGLKYFYKDSESNPNVVHRWLAQRDKIERMIEARFMGEDLKPYVTNYGVMNKGQFWAIIIPDYTKESKFNVKLSFQTYLYSTPKAKVVRYLNDRITKRVTMGMTKDWILDVCDSYGLIESIESDMNTWRGHSDFKKYGL